MPFEWHVDEVRGSLLIAVRGAWEAPPRARAFLTELIRNGHWSAEALVLVDLRELEPRTVPHFGDLWARAQQQAGTPLPRRLALLAAPGVSFGLARMLQELMHADVDRVRTFDNEDEALVWLTGGPGAPRPT